MMEIIDGSAVEIRDYSAKHDQDKLRPSLICESLIEAVMQIREYGCKKYGDPENWRKVEPKRYEDAMWRHILQCKKYGIDSIDEESGYPHLWHAACNIMFLIEMKVNVTNKYDEHL